MTALTHSGGGYMDPFSRYLIEFEPEGDPSEGGAGGDPSPAPAGGDGGAPTPAAGDPGAAETAPEVAPAVSPSIDDLLSSPEAQAQISRVIEQREQAQQQAILEREREAAAQTEFSDVEEAFGLLGVTPDRINAYFGRANAPLAQAAQEFQTRQAVDWVEGQLSELGRTAYADLLGDGVKTLAELTNEDGQALFQPDLVAKLNHDAVLFAAAGVQGPQNLDHAAALQTGAKIVADRDTLIAKIAVERYKRELAGTSGAPRDISSGGQGAHQLSGIEGGDEMSVARRINAEARRA